MKQFALLFFCLFQLQVFSQTKLIAYKSHSGNAASFHSFLEKFPNVDASNFGIPPTQNITDTVEYIPSKNLIVLKSREYRYKPRKNDPIRIDSMKKQVLSASYTIDSVKKWIIKNNRETKVDSAVYIGFEPLKSKKKNSKKGWLPLLAADQFPTKFLLIISLLGISLLVAFLKKKREASKLPVRQK